MVGVFGRSDPVIHGPAPHLPGRVVTGPHAREWGTRERRGLPPFREPDPEAVVAAALELLDERIEASSESRNGRRLGERSELS